MPRGPETERELQEAGSAVGSDMTALLQHNFTVLKNLPSVRAQHMQPYVTRQEPATLPN